MINKLWRTICLLLAFVMIFGMSSAFAITSSDIIVDLTRLDNIKRCGLPATTEHRKTGSFSMKWAGADIYRDITIPISKTDFSNVNFVEMWVYSENESKEKFTLAFMSNNSLTPCPDYYYTTISVNWTGWRLISLQIAGDESDFSPVTIPTGWNSINEIKLWPNYGGNTPVDGTALYFDKIYTTVERSADAADGGSTADDGKIILADFSKRSNVVAAGFPASSEQVLSGDVTLKWAEADLKRAPKITLPTTDWSNYGLIEMDMYSEKATGSDIKLAVVSENPSTEGPDYYIASIIIDWVGWKKVAFYIGDSGNFGKSRTPLGWNNITDFAFWTIFGGKEVDASTVLYIDKIWLSGVASDGSFDNSTNFIIPSSTKSDFEDAIGLLKTKNPNGIHPRLLMHEEDFTNLKSLIINDPYMKRTYQNLIGAAEAALVHPIQTYGLPDGKRLLRDAPNMMPPLAMAYKLTGEAKYKERLWKEIEAVAAFPDWNPSHFLDVGDFSRGMTLAYDWLYHDWDETQRRTMRNALVRHGFAPSMAFLRNKSGFAGQVNNWNEVINAGIGMAALAIGDEPGYEGLANEVINLTVDSLPTGLNSFSPDGACPEGPGYWGYSMSTFFQYNNCMFDAMGTDFGLSKITGLSKTGYFLVTMHGPNNLTFNYADAGSEMVRTGVLFWIARLYDQPELGGYEIETGPNGGDWSDLAMYRPDARQSNFREDMPLDILFKGEQNVASIRSTWNDKNALFVGFKGGHNQASHGDLDIGSFVLDALGVRWVMEPGGEWYEAPGMWDFKKGGGRWTYYRKRAEGQNTLVINPKITEDQDPYATSEISKFEQSDSAVYGIVDMSQAYSEDVSEAKRGFALINNRSAVIVQDEIKNTKPAEIYSFFHTATSVEVAADGKSAIMTQNKKKMKVNLLSPDNASFQLMDAVPLPTSPNPKENKDNSAMKKLAVHMTNALNPTISVLFTPMKEDQPETSLPSLLPLSEWDLFKTGGAQLQAITIDGVPLEGFSPNNLSYELKDGVLGNVEAVTNKETDIEITQAEKIGNSTFIRVIQKQTGMQSIYSITFEERVPTTIMDTLKLYEIKGVEASEVPEPQNNPNNTFDKKLSTRWSAAHKQWIVWDLGEEKPINAVMIAFMNGSQRSTIFNLEVSLDGTNYTRVFDGRSSGRTDSLESYKFENTTGRYIRFNGSGNTVNEWNSITEIGFVEPLKSFEDIDEHWANPEISYMTNLGLANGKSDTLFAPEDSVTRAEFIAMTARADKLSATAYKGAYADVKAEDWFADIVQAAVNEELIPKEMTADGNLYPNLPITREEICAIIIKTYERNKMKQIPTYGLERFADKDQISDYAKPYVDKGISLRMIKGIDETLFAPKANATRAQAIVLVKRLFVQIAE